MLGWTAIQVHVNSVERQLHNIPYIDRESNLLSSSRMKMDRKWFVENFCDDCKFAGRAKVFHGAERKERYNRIRMIILRQNEKSHKTSDDLWKRILWAGNRPPFTICQDSKHGVRAYRASDGAGKVLPHRCLYTGGRCKVYSDVSGTLNVLSRDNEFPQRLKSVPDIHYISRLTCRDAEGQGNRFRALRSCLHHPKIWSFMSS